jgi:hypothetical protein
MISESPDNARLPDTGSAAALVFLRLVATFATLLAKRGAFSVQLRQARC